MSLILPGMPPPGEGSADGGEEAAAGSKGWGRWRRKERVVKTNKGHVSTIDGEAGAVAHAPRAGKGNERTDEKIQNKKKQKSELPAAESQDDGENGNTQQAAGSTSWWRSMRENMAAKEFAFFHEQHAISKKNLGNKVRSNRLIKQESTAIPAAAGTSQKGSTKKQQQQQQQQQQEMVQLFQIGKSSQKLISSKHITTEAILKHQSHKKLILLQKQQHDQKKQQSKRQRQRSSSSSRHSSTQLRQFDDTHKGSLKRQSVETREKLRSSSSGGKVVIVNKDERQPSLAVSSSASSSVLSVASTDQLSTDEAVDSKELDAARIKSLFCSTDITGMQHACVEIATAIAESARQDQQQQSKSRRRGRGQRQQQQPAFPSLTLDTLHLIRLEILLQTRILTLLQEQQEHAEKVQKLDASAASERPSLESTTVPSFRLASIHRRVARLWSLYGDHDLAMQQIRKALQWIDNDPDQHKTFRLQARLLARVARFHEAIESLQHAIQCLEQQQQPPRDVQKQDEEEAFRSGLPLSESKRRFQSFKKWGDRNVSYEQDNEMVATYMEMAHCLERLRLFDEALDVLEPCCDRPELHPHLRAVVHGKVGLLYEVLGDDESALQYMTKAHILCLQHEHLETARTQKMRRLLQKALLAISFRVSREHRRAEAAALEEQKALLEAASQPLLETNVIEEVLAEMEEEASDHEPQDVVSIEDERLQEEAENEGGGALYMLPHQIMGSPQATTHDDTVSMSMSTISSLTQEEQKEETIGRGTGLLAAVTPEAQQQHQYDDASVFSYENVATYLDDLFEVVTDDEDSDDEDGEDEPLDPDEAAEDHGDSDNMAEGSDDHAEEEGISSAGDNNDDVAFEETVEEAAMSGGTQSTNATGHLPLDRIEEEQSERTSEDDDYDDDQAPTTPMDGGVVLGSAMAPLPVVEEGTEETSSSSEDEKKGVAASPADPQILSEESGEEAAGATVESKTPMEKTALAGSAVKVANTRRQPGAVKARQKSAPSPSSGRKPTVVARARSGPASLLKNTVASAARSAQREKERQQSRLSRPKAVRTRIRSAPGRTNAGSNDGPARPLPVRRGTSFSAEEGRARARARVRLRKLQKRALAVGGHTSDKVDVFTVLQTLSMDPDSLRSYLMAEDEHEVAARLRRQSSNSTSASRNSSTSSGSYDPDDPNNPRYARHTKSSAQRYKENALRWSFQKHLNDRRASLMTASELAGLAAEYDDSESFTTSMKKPNVTVAGDANRQGQAVVDSEGTIRSEGDANSGGVPLVEHHGEGEEQYLQALSDVIVYLGDIDELEWLFFLPSDNSWLTAAEATEDELIAAVQSDVVVHLGEVDEMDQDNMMCWAAGPAPISSDGGAPEDTANGATSTASEGETADGKATESEPDDEPSPAAEVVAENTVMPHTDTSDEEFFSAEEAGAIDEEQDDHAEDSSSHHSDDELLRGRMAPSRRPTLLMSQEEVDAALGRIAEDSDHEAVDETASLASTSSEESQASANDLSPKAPEVPVDIATSNAVPSDDEEHIEPTSTLLLAFGGIGAAAVRSMASVASMAGMMEDQVSNDDDAHPPGLVSSPERLRRDEVLDEYEEGPPSPQSVSTIQTTPGNEDGSTGKMKSDDADQESNKQKVPDLKSGFLDRMRKRRPKASNMPKSVLAMVALGVVLAGERSKSESSMEAEEKERAAKASTTEKRTSAKDQQQATERVQGLELHQREKNENDDGDGSGPDTDVFARFDGLESQLHGLRFRGLAKQLENLEDKLTHLVEEEDDEASTTGLNFAIQDFLDDD